MKLDRVMALEPRVLPPLGMLDLVVVWRGFGQRKIPERLFWRNVDHAHMSGFGCAGFTDPLDAKVNSVLAVRQTDNFVEIERRFDTAQLDSLLADVDGDCLLGENLAAAAGAEDAHRHLLLFARIAASAHLH